MFKNQMKPLTPGGQTIVHKGKGSKQAPMSARNNVVNSGAMTPGAGINNYAKATPMAAPASPAPDGLGSGTWPGNGQ